MVRLNPWHSRVNATVAASLFALPEPDRLGGARVAHEAGLWVHADVILTSGETGFHNVGVGLDVIRQALCLGEGVAVDVHVMLLDRAPGWEASVHAVAQELAGWGVRRISAEEHLLPILRRAGDAAEWWLEVWPPRDSLTSGAEHDGILVMLIEPGSTGAADTSGVAEAITAAGELPVGVDGGVTEEVASECVHAGSRYLVSGRALLS